MSRTIVEVFDGLLKDAKELSADTVEINGTFYGENDGWGFTVKVFSDAEKIKIPDGAEVKEDCAICGDTDCDCLDDDEDEIDDETADLDDKGSRCNCHCDGCGEECEGTDVNPRPLQIIWVEPTENKPSVPLLSMHNDGRFEITKAACSSPEAKIVIEELCNFINNVSSYRQAQQELKK